MGKTRDPPRFMSSPVKQRCGPGGLQPHLDSVQQPGLSAGTPAPSQPGASIRLNYFTNLSPLSKSDIHFIGSRAPNLCLWKQAQPSSLAFNPNSLELVSIFLPHTHTCVNVYSEKFSMNFPLKWAWSTGPQPGISLSCWVKVKFSFLRLTWSGWDIWGCLLQTLVVH